MYRLLSNDTLFLVPPQNHSVTLTTLKTVFLNKLYKVAHLHWRDGIVHHIIKLAAKNGKGDGQLCLKFV